MEVNFSELKQKDVINISDGRHLGKVCDVLFSFPQNAVLGFTVTGCKGFKFSKQEIFLPIATIVKIGEDAVLVKFGKDDDKKPPKNDRDCPPPNDGCCPPPFCPPCPPNNCPPNNCPPPNRPQGNRPPQGFPPQNRRSLDEYE